MVQILKGISFLGIIVVLIIRDFNMIGQINYYTNPKKNKKVIIKNKRLKKLIPYKPQHFVLPWDNEDPVYSDGTIYKRTCILTIVFYIVEFCVVIVSVFLCVQIFLGREQQRLFKILIVATFGILFVFTAVILPWGEWLRYKDKKNKKKKENSEGWTNCRP